MSRQAATPEEPAAPPPKPVPKPAARSTAATLAVLESNSNASGGEEEDGSDAGVHAVLLALRSRAGQERMKSVAANSPWQC